MIKPIDGFTGVADADVLSRGYSVQTSLTGNTNYPSLPVDLATFKTALDTFSALIAEALDGGKKVIAQKTKQRTTVIKMLRLLGRYVEVTCNGDHTAFNGEDPQSRTRRQQRRNQYLAQGCCQSFELRISIRRRERRSSDHLDDDAAFECESAHRSKGVDARHDLFQARALVKDTFTDWSDSVSFICT